MTWNTPVKIAGSHVTVQECVTGVEVGMPAVKGLLTEMLILQNVVEAFLQQMRDTTNAWLSLSRRRRLMVSRNTKGKIAGLHVTAQVFVAGVEMGMRAVKGLLTEMLILQSAAKAFPRQMRITTSAWLSLTRPTWNTLGKIAGSHVTVQDFVTGVEVGMPAVKGL